MTTTGTITPKELERQANLALAGKSYILMLCLNASSLNIGSTWAAWEGDEISGGGYARITGTTGSASYNTTTGRIEIPLISATFTASGVGFLFDTAVLRVDGATYPHSVLTESSAISLAAGQPYRYVLFLNQDN